MVLEIIIIKFSGILKIMARNTFPESQPDSASYLRFCMVPPKLEIQLCMDPPKLRIRFIIVQTYVSDSICSQ